MDTPNIQSIPPAASILYTKHDGKFDCVTTVVKNISDNTIEVEFVEDYFSKVVFIGDILICKTVIKSHSYILHCVVKAIKIPSSSIVLDIVNFKKVLNLRLSKRYDVSMISTILTNKSDEFYSIVVNISKEGLCIFTTHDIQHTKNVDIILYPDSYNSKLLISCEIRWSNRVGNTNLYGLGICEISNENKSIYNNFMDTLEQKEKMLLSVLKHN